MKKICKNCGFENAEKDKFCRKCGTKLDVVKQTVEKKKDEIKEETIEYKEPKPQPRKERASLPKEDFKISSKMIFGISIVAIIISIAAISSAFLVSPSSLGASAVGTSELANNSVTGQKLADGTITDSDIDPLGISRIKANSITGDQIVNYTISLTHLKGNLADMITGMVEIADNSITTEKIKNGTIIEDDLAADSITSTKIKDGEVKSNDIATDAVTSSKIASGAVGTSELEDGSVSYAKMGIKIRYGQEENVVHGTEIDHNLGAKPTTITVTPRYNSSLQTKNAIIIANVYGVDSDSFKVALSICYQDGAVAKIVKVDGSTWGAEDIDWVAVL